MTTLEILRAARSKIAKPENWTQREYARDAGGCRVSSDSDSACSWCAAGAVLSLPETYSGTCQAIDALRRELSVVPREADTEFDLGVYNDTHTHEEVLAVFDAAIARESKK